MSVTAHPTRRPGRRRSIAADVVVTLLLLLGAVVTLAPLLYMLSTSVKTMTDAFKFPPEWLPDPLVWRNYLDVWSEIPLRRMLFNSLKVSGLCVAGTLLSCSLAGYAFARLRFWGRDVLFVCLLATLMVPSQVTLIPTFLLMREFGWVNTHLPLFVPAWFAPAFGTFLMRQFYKTVPRELEEAARLDGATPFRVYRDIFLPLSGPVMAALAIFTFLASWNNLLGPLVYLQDRDLMTFPVGLTWLSGHYVSQLPLLMTAATISIVPTIVVFLFLQRYFVQGIVLTGMKG